MQASTDWQSAAGEAREAESDLMSSLTRGTALEALRIEGADTRRRVHERRLPPLFRFASVALRYDSREDISPASYTRAIMTAGWTVRNRRIACRPALSVRICRFRALDEIASTTPYDY